jgi:hypothetical protein
MPTSSSSLSPLSPSAQQQLSAFCPRELSRFMTHDNHELRGRIQDFLKVSFLRWSGGVERGRKRERERKTNGEARRPAEGRSRRWAVVVTFRWARSQLLPRFLLPFSRCGTVRYVASTPMSRGEQREIEELHRAAEEKKESGNRTKLSLRRRGLSWKAPLLAALVFFDPLAHSPLLSRPSPSPPPLQDPLFAPNAVHGLSLSANRDLTLERLLRYVRRGQFFSVRDYGRDPRRFMAGLESLALVDYSLCIKAGVHFTLCVVRFLLETGSGGVLPGERVLFYPLPPSILSL